MTFHCKNFNLENGQCKRLSGECVPARKGCVLEGRIAVTDELAERIAKINEETLRGSEKSEKNNLAKAIIDPALLGFDFDGVIADTAEVFLRLACEDYGLCDLTSADIVNFEVEQCLGLERAQVDAIFTKVLLDSVGTGLQPMKDAIQVLGELAELSPVSVITARPLAAPVHDWFAHFFPASTCKAIKVTAMGAHDGKPQYIHEQGLHFFIDDRAETCVQLSRAGVHPFVFHQPWNHNRHQLPSVSSWQDIRELIS